MNFIIHPNRLTVFISKILTVKQNESVLPAPKSKAALEAKVNELQNGITRIERSKAALAAKKKDVITKIEKGNVFFSKMSLTK